MEERRNILCIKLRETETIPDLSLLEMLPGKRAVCIFVFVEGWIMADANDTEPYRIEIPPLKMGRLLFRVPAPSEKCQHRR